MNRSNILAIATLTALIGLIEINTAYAQPLDIRLAKVYIGENGGDRFSNGISAVGDLNNDGYNDFLIGARWWEGGQTSAIGRVYVYLGGETLPDEPTLILQGEDIGQVFGGQLSGIGDINGDGYDDFSVRAAGYLRGNGSVYVYLGGDSLSDEPIAYLEGAEDEMLFGRSITGGDINNDGYSDLIIGAAWSSNVNPPGFVSVYFGGETFDTDPDWISSGFEDGSGFGRFVLTGDINGDSVDDLIVTESLRNSDSSLIHIFYGGDTINALSDVKIIDANSTSIAVWISVGDLNGDAFDDIAAYSLRTGTQNIYYGSTNFDDVVDVDISTDDMGSSIGNINKDIYDDLILGNANRFRIRVFRGGSPFDSEADFTNHQGSFSTAFGGPEALGDVNGDGAGDFLVSEVFGGDFFNPEGQAYLYLGDTSFVISVEPEPVIVPASFLTLQAYPNPFNPITTINYALPVAGRVKLIIYNLRGQEVARLVDREMKAGWHTAIWDASNVASGIYFYRLQAGGFALTKKMLLLK